MAVDMTQGNIPKKLTTFAVPLILGNIFQLTYNAADSIIVGRFVGTNALAAVGTSSPIMNIVIFFIVGICMGTSVLMSEYYGAQDIEKLKKEIATSIVVGAMFSAIMTIIGLCSAPYVLKLMNTPKDIIDIASSYLRIVFCGLIFTFIYNIYAAALRSVGDSKTPIYFLMFSSVLNVGLDYIFIVLFNMETNGVAYATVISQIISSVMCIIYVNKKVPLIRIKVKNLKIDKILLKNTINYSWVTGMQQICLYIGKVLIQSTVNSLGLDSIATFNAVNRVDDFVFQPQQSIASSLTIFIAQNRGAGKKERINSGLKIGLLLEIIYWIVIALIVRIFSSQIMNVFVLDKTNNVVSLGIIYLNSMSIFYLLPAVTNGIQGYFRGMGDLKVTLFSTLVQIIGRVIFAYILVPKYGVAGIAFSCLIGWICMLLFELPIFCISRLTERK